MTAGQRHRLAVRVAKASRLAGGPIGYYHAHADIQSLEAAYGWNVDACETFYSAHFGAAWTAAAPNPADAIVEERA